MKTPIIFKSLNLVCKHNILRNVKRENWRRENTTNVFCLWHPLSEQKIYYFIDDSGINSPGMSKWRNFPRPKRPLRCLFPLPVCNRDEFELRGKLLCEFAGFVLGALRFLYSVGSIDYVCQKSVSIALNKEFTLERSENGKLIFSVSLLLSLRKSA